MEGDKSIVEHKAIMNDKMAEYSFDGVKMSPQEVLDMIDKYMPNDKTADAYRAEEINSQNIQKALS